MSVENPRPRAIPWRSLGSLVALLASAVLMYLWTPEKKSDIKNPGGDPPLLDTQLRSEKELKRIFGSMRAGHLDSVLNRRDAADELNRWSNDFPHPEDKPLTADVELLTKLLPADALEQVLSPRFLPADAAHLRMSLLARDILDQIESSQPQGDLSPGEHEGRILATLFDFVRQNVADLPAQQPNTPYEVLMQGRGTAVDRIWVFAELVRQIPLDTVVITPTNAVKGSTHVVGVICSDGEVRLFEPDLGIPLFDPVIEAANLFPVAPVTLSVVRDNPEVLKQLSVNARPELGNVQFQYPMTSSDLTQVTVAIVGSAAQWAPRMATVEFRTPPEVRSRVYAGLGQNALRESGAYDRVFAAGEHHRLWTANDITLWPLPFTLEAEHAALHANPTDAYQALQQIMTGPIVPVPERGTVRRADTTLEDVRIEQLSGKYATALSHLLPIRNAYRRLPDTINLYAADFATYRAAQCQLHIGQLDAAANTLSGYLSDDPGAQRWRMEANEEIALIRMQALIAATADEAVDLKSPLDQIQTKDPLSHRLIFLLNRWHNLMQSQGKLAGPATPIAAGPPLLPTPPEQGTSPGDSSATTPPAPALPEELPRE